MRSTDFRADAKAGATCFFRPASAHCRYPVTPGGLVQAFVLRMAGHGVWVSSAMMACDHRYALLQLATAHCSDDAALREMAMMLFLDVERRPGSGPRH